MVDYWKNICANTSDTTPLIFESKIDQENVDAKIAPWGTIKVQLKDSFFKGNEKLKICVGNQSTKAGVKKGTFIINRAKKNVICIIKKNKEIYSRVIKAYYKEGKANKAKVIAPIKK